MDASLQSRAEQLASAMAGEATTIEDLNGLMRQMMKSAMERMLDTEMDVHLGRKSPTLPEDQSCFCGKRAGSPAAEMLAWMFSIFRRTSNAWTQSQRSASTTVAT